MRTPVALALFLALAGCTQNAVDQPHYPIAVLPAADNPERLVAVPPACGPTPTTVPRTHVNAWHNTQFGMGCSQARNLGVMIDDPRDLLGGRPTLPDAEREAAAVERYRKGEEKPLQAPGAGYIRPSTGGQ